MKYFLSIAIIIILSLSSCSFEEEYAFQSDWSGKYEGVLDMSGVAEMGGEDKESEEIIPEAEKKAMEEKINAVEGISNAKVMADEENYKISFSYDFEDLASLNTLNSQDLSEGDDDSPLGSLAKWEMSSKGKKKFYITMMKDEGMTSDEEGMEEMKQAGDMLQVTSTLTFPRKVKDVISDVANKGTQDNQVIIKYSLKDIFDTEKNWDTEVRLK